MQVEPNTDQTAYTSQKKKSTTLTETALPKSTNTHADASACTAAQYAEEKKSTYTYGNASARPASGRVADRHTEERTTQRVEDAASSTQRSNVDGDTSLQEFDHEEVVTTTSMEEGLSSLQLILTRDVQSPTISTQQEASTEKRDQKVLYRVIAP